GLERGALALPLLGFNLGVELGQLLVVALLLPLAFLLRETRAYRLGAVRLGSTAIAALAALWLVERAFDVSLLPA
uniref:HupE/UreJ family protein n=1 Tax=Caldimonas tepidiphila TaxID=2315841 RepID=UPI00196A2C9B